MTVEALDDGRGDCGGWGCHHDDPIRIVVEAVQLACATSGRHQGVAAIDVPQVDVSPRGDEGFPD